MLLSNFGDEHRGLRDYVINWYLFPRLYVQQSTKGGGEVRWYISEHGRKEIWCNSSSFFVCLFRFLLSFFFQFIATINIYTVYRGTDVCSMLFLPFIWSQLSQSGHYCKADTSLRRTWLAWLVPAEFHLFSSNLTLFKADTSIRRTAGAGPEGVRFRERVHGTDVCCMLFLPFICVCQYGLVQLTFNDLSENTEMCSERFLFSFCKCKHEEKLPREGQGSCINKRRTWKQ